MKWDSSSQFEVGFGNLVDDFVVRILQWLYAPSALREPEASEAHLVMFAQTIQSTPANGVMLSQTSCPLLIGESPHDYKWQLTTPKSRNRNELGFITALLVRFDGTFFKIKLQYYSICRIFPPLL